MTMPEIIKKAIEAQGKYAVEEIEEKLEALEPDDVLLGVLGAEDEEQEVLDLGPVEPAEHA